MAYAQPVNDLIGINRTVLIAFSTGTTDVTLSETATLANSGYITFDRLDAAKRELCHYDSKNDAAGTVHLDIRGIYFDEDGAKQTGVGTAHASGVTAVVTADAAIFYDLVNEDVTFAGDETFTGTVALNGALTIGAAWTAASQTCANLGTVSAATSITTSALVATTADINAGTIDGTVIGAASAAAGTFTTLTASSTLGVSGDTTIQRSESGGDVILAVNNLSNTADSDARLQAYVAGTSAGDPYALFSVAGAGAWTLGLDNSDSDKFVISKGTALGTNNAVTINSSYDCQFTGRVGFGPGTLDANHTLEVYKATGSSEIGILCADGTSEGIINFGDSYTGTARYEGRIAYSHTTNDMTFLTDHTLRATLSSTGLNLASGLVYQINGSAITPSGTSTRFTRSSGQTGAYAVTGVGFQPRVVYIFASSGGPVWTIGNWSAASGTDCLNIDNAGNTTSGSNLGTGTNYAFDGTSLDADGFTVNVTAITATVTFECICCR